MEWVEVTAKSVESAKELALDRLGISVDDAEFDVVEEPRSGLFGRIRGEARVRARVKPTMVRQKHERRNRRSGEGGRSTTPTPTTEVPAEPAGGAAADETTVTVDDGDARRRRRGRNRREESPAAVEHADCGDPQQGGAMEEREDDNAEVVAVEDVRAAAEEFARGLVGAFGLQATTSSMVEGNEIEVRVDSGGDGLGLLIGPSGRTLLAIQDLARVAAQRRLGDHDTRLRVDVAGYRETRRAALERFAGEVAELVKQSGVARSLEPMPSSDRKVIHDTLTAIDGVVSRSEGEDPYRRIIVSPS